MSYILYLDEQYLWGSSESGVSAYVIGDPKLSMEINKAGSLEFDIPPVHPKYNSMINLKSVITVFDDQKEIWRGRVLSQEDDINKIRHVTCEGELAYLNDTYTWPHGAINSRNVDNWMDAIFDHYNGINGTNTHSEYRNLMKGRVVGFDSSQKIAVDEKDEWHSDATELFEELLGNISGFIRIRHSNNGLLTDPGYVDIYATAADQSTQTIELGVNLTDYSHTKSGEETFTALIPVGGTVRNLVPETSVEPGSYSSSGKIDKANWWRSRNLIALEGYTTLTVDFNSPWASNDEIITLWTWTGEQPSEPSAVRGFGIGAIGKKGHHRYVVTFGSNAKYFAVGRRAELGSTFSVSLGNVKTKDTNATGNQKLVIGSDSYVDEDSVEFLKNDSGIKKYGFILRSQSYDIDDDWQTLKTLGQATLNAGINETESFEISAVDMRDLGANVDELAIGDLVKIISAPHKIDAFYQLTKIDLDLDDPSSNLYSLGLISSSISGSVISNSQRTVGSSTSSVISSVTNAVTSNISENYVTKEELNDAVSGIPSSSVVTKLQSDVGDLQTKLEALTTRVEALEKKG